jgi:DNA-binding winged helix-turn-helix (wHTH) protein/tetratricopeptide (TPR) repeat protein
VVDSLLGWFVKETMASKPKRFFSPFCLDSENAQLWRGDEEVNLRRKTFDLLCCLVDHPGDLLTKEALLDAVWPEVAVSDSMPATSVVELRRALGDGAKKPRFIETVHGRGYRFIAPVTIEMATAGKTPPIGKAKPSSVNGPRPIIVGRTDEFAKLRSWYAQVIDGRRRVIFVAGEAGIGKTTFVQEFLDSIAAEGTCLTIRGQCVEQYGPGEPYMPVFEALTRLCGEAGGARVVELLHRFAPSWLTQMPSVLSESDRRRLRNSAQAVTQQRMLREMREALDALTAETPLLMLLEDLHWSDFSTLELISAIARRTEPARLMILATYRSAEMLASDHPLRRMKDELRLHDYCEELRLKLLTVPEVAEYLAKRFVEHGPFQLDRIAPIVHERTEGNPLFMVNVADYLAGAGAMASLAAQSAETFALGDFDTPHSIRQMIERNLERLESEEQAVLEAAAVAGADFSAASVAAALERPQQEVEACCTRLSRREQFIRAQGSIEWPDNTIAGRYIFLHALYLDVLYGRVAPGQRAESHRRIAEREESAYGERSDEIATELANHYSRAKDRQKAIQYLWLAGQRTVIRGSAVEAERHYRRALTLLDELPAGAERDRHELKLQLALGDALCSSKSWSHPEATCAYERAEDLADKLGENKQLARVLLGLAISALASAQVRLGRALGERMLSAGEISGDRALLCAGHYSVGEALLWQAQYLEAKTHFELSRNYHDEGSAAEIAGILASALLPIALLMLGYADRAREVMAEALARAESYIDPLKIGALHLWGGVFTTMLRDVGGTIEHSRVLTEMAAKQPVWTAIADVTAARTLILQGTREEGGRYLRKAIAAQEEAGLQTQRVFAQLDEAECLATQGEIDEALTVINDLINDTEFTHLSGQALQQRPSLLEKRGESDAAIEEAYKAAMEFARVHGTKYYELQATTSFALWLGLKGRPGEAHRMLAGIYGWFSEGFDTFPLREAKAALNELTNTRDAISTVPQNKRLRRSPSTRSQGV